MSDLTGWDRLRHGGLLLDAARLRAIAEHVPGRLYAFHEQDLRRRIGAMLDGDAEASDFADFVLRKICGFGPEVGDWQRGPQVGAEWGRRAVTGEAVKPRMLWRGRNGATLPVFMDDEPRLGVGRGRRAVSQVAQWLRSGSERLAVLTSGRQWRLLFAGLDFDAWCEWDVDLWLEEGALSPQVAALRTLISPQVWTPPAPDAPPPLLRAILDSRKGQADLSAALGERVREAVEWLVQAHGEVLKTRCADVDPADIYRAAVRVVMRMVVALFAESRELLPRDNALYHGAYGLTGLLEALEKAAARGGNRLARSWNAWPRVLALFRLVHRGAHHPKLSVPAYGGTLFAPGDPDGDRLSRALTVFETACFDRELMADREVHRMLDRITRTRIRVRQGRSSITVSGPVDFSDLSSEYIGILYEGLLDFELKTAPPGDPVVFLAVGAQPALPLSRLEAMDDRALAGLLDKMKDASRAGEEAEDGPGEEVAEAEEVGDEPAEEVEEGTEEETDPGDARHATRTRAEAWARRAVEIGKLARRPKGALTPEKRLAYEDAVGRKARQLVTRVILPGEWYLVRWGGTRKGSGAFYTRPGLAIPTVHRTLRPLAYAPPDGPDQDALSAAWTPKPPEEILALQVCDPACGSGTFPVAALRFLTEALYASLHHHGRISADGERAVAHLLSPAPPPGADGERLGHELLPCRPDDPLFEPRLKAILKRYVVERSIYGVDLDPLAVELCRLSLWVETMDRSLPFSFLDHKIKCGNALVGAWFDQFRHYPAMAFKNREGGDKGHANGVHFEPEARTRAIKAFVKDRLTPDLRRFLEGPTLFSEDLQEKAGEAHAEALATLSRLHDLPVQDSAERARIYREDLIGSDAHRSLKAAMDLWCACWFWPADALECAPLPTTLSDPPEATRALTERLAARKRFFHWELEFPDVFRAAGSGFDAILGNPPWNIAKPNSMEFFSSIDPLYRSYGKQEALRYQSDYFRDAEVERAWLDYSADFRAQSNFIGYAASSFGDPTATDKGQDRFPIARGRENETLHERWRKARAKRRGFADAAHPFQYQGSADINLYKTFLEQAHALLRRGGRLGFIVPSGLYSDHGTGDLRELFLDRCQWEWLFGFENREKVFEIDSRFKFNPVIVSKGGRTEAIRTAFMRRRLEDWERAEALATPYTRAQVERFSPRSKAILEIQSQRDLEILEKIYANSVLLGDDGPDGWGIQYAREFDMTNDSKLFPPRPKWEADGYRPDEYSRWLKGDWRPIAELWADLGVKPLAEGERRCAQPPYDMLPIPRADIPAGIMISREADAWIREEGVEDVALPLYEGRMIGQFDFNQKGWSSGKGRGAQWTEIDCEHKILQPQYLMGAQTFLKSPTYSSASKASLIAIVSGTNSRGFVCTTIPNYPCSHPVPVFRSSTNACVDTLVQVALLNSLPFDWCFRARLGSGVMYVSPHLIGEGPSPVLIRSHVRPMASVGASVAFCSQLFAVEWLRLQSSNLVSRAFRGPTRCWARANAERVRIRCIIDALFAALYTLGHSDLRWILRDCSVNSPSPERGSRATGLSPKGFWRVDKDKDPELRHTVLTLVAFHDLEEKIRACDGDREKGIEAFLAQNGGEGWMLPETLRLADYGLGHDERAKVHQPVASRLGPRFYDWQLAQSAEESWRECHLHARNMLGEAGYQRLLKEIEGGEHETRVAEPKAPYARRDPQIKLFE